MGMRAHQLRNPWNMRNEDNIVQMAREQYARAFMKKRLDTMTAVTDSSGPKCVSMRHLELRLKKVQLMEDRKQAIAKDNRKLMEQMTAIIKGKGKKPLYTPAHHLNKSLNERERREYVERVNLDNKLFLDRLKGQTAYINVKKMEDDFQKWLENRKVCSKAYKRLTRAKQLEARQKRLDATPSSTSGSGDGGSRGRGSRREGSGGKHSKSLSPTPGTSTGASVGEPASAPAAGEGAMPFRTAKQLKDGLIREGKGGFVPLPTLVPAPPASTQPNLQIFGQDTAVRQVGGQKVQFGIQHQGSLLSAGQTANSSLTSLPGTV